MESFRLLGGTASVGSVATQLLDGLYSPSPEALLLRLFSPLSFLAGLIFECFFYGIIVQCVLADGSGSIKACAHLSSFSRYGGVDAI